MITNASADVTEQISRIATGPVPTRTRARRRAFAWVTGAGVGVWVGLLLAAAGFGLIAFTWGKTAALLDVALQLPYVVSGGLSGIGLVLIGLLVVNLSVKRKEARTRERQLDQLREALESLRAAVEGDDEAR